MAACTGVTACAAAAALARCSSSSSLSLSSALLPPKAAASATDEMRCSMVAGDRVGAARGEARLLLLANFKQGDQELNRLARCAALHHVSIPAHEPLPPANPAPAHLCGRLLRSPAEQSDKIEHHKCNVGHASHSLERVRAAARVVRGKRFCSQHCLRGAQQRRPCCSSCCRAAAEEDGQLHCDCQFIKLLRRLAALLLLLSLARLPPLPLLWVC